MDKSALEYLKRRAEEEADKAITATSKSVGAIHRELADAYLKQIVAEQARPAP